MSKVALALLVLGLLQMTGDVLQRAGMERIGAPLKAIGAATTASPAPKVFSAVEGLETYSTRFFLEWDGQSVLLTPELYARVRGPYNRRNVFGAALAYGPVLASNPRTRPMWEAVMRYALCGEAPLLDELGIEAVGARVRCEPLPGTDMGSLPRVLEVDCP